MRVATLSEMLEEVVHLGEATGMEEHAHELRGELEGRLATVRAAVAEAGLPRVIALESLDPPRVAGFWIPEMISIAGGVDVAGDPGLNPAEVGWGELSSLNAAVVVVMPDGSATDAQAQAMEHWEQIASLLAGSFGALLLDPHTFTVGASGAIFGVFAAAFLLARGRGLDAIAGQLAILIVINLAFTFTDSEVSVGGHLGGLVGGAICGAVVIAGERGMLGRNHRAAELLAMTAVGVFSFLGALAVA